VTKNKKHRIKRPRGVSHILQELSMPSSLVSDPSLQTLSDLLEHLGGIAPNRVRFHPLPGTATEQDIFDLQAREGRLYELVEYVLVEKAMGFRESCLAAALITILWGFVRPKNLGLVAGEGGMMRLAPGLVRIPDVAFVSWERLPNRRMPTEPVPGLVPDLAVEVLSTNNTPGEMERKRREYFTAGVQLVWCIDPDARTVAVFTDPEHCIVLSEEQTLAGEPVLPTFTLPLHQLFAELDRQGD
jgi:Uma2 family endonuclease